MFRLHFLGRSGIVIFGAMLAGKNVLLSQPRNIFHPYGRKNRSDALCHKMSQDFAKAHGTFFEHLSKLMHKKKQMSRIF
jgi:hypothetical protein